MLKLMGRFGCPLLMQRRHFWCKEVLRLASSAFKTSMMTQQRHLRKVLRGDHVDDGCRVSVEHGGLRVQTLTRYLAQFPGVVYPCTVRKRAFHSSQQHANQRVKRKWVEGGMVTISHSWAGSGMREVAN
mmetsp:Transcript_87975/g.146878  ORF Transcript_87975/g.146878 Transcript_87975/m.146878 type:complete len:129 (-) Transcript_87975:1551-1937(-)